MHPLNVFTPLINDDSFHHSMNPLPPLNEFFPPFVRILLLSLFIILLFYFLPGPLNPLIWILKLYSITVNYTLVKFNQLRGYIFDVSTDIKNITTFIEDISNFFKTILNSIAELLGMLGPKAKLANLKIAKNCTGLKDEALIKCKTDNMYEWVPFPSVKVKKNN